jgi:hypothetical protein
LARNKSLWPAIVIFPSGLAPEIVYAQCTFTYRPNDAHTYKEASGINNFLRKGRLVEFIREYNVASLMVRPKSLADSFYYALDEPRIEESLFVVEQNGSAVPYRSERKKAHGISATGGRPLEGALPPQTAPAVDPATSSSGPSLIPSILKRLFR